MRTMAGAMNFLVCELTIATGGLGRILPVRYWDAIDDGCKPDPDWRDFTHATFVLSI